MHAFIFDIDGTLLDSCSSDDFFIEAIHETFGPVHLRADWGQYTHATDSGALAEICSDNGIMLQADQLHAVQDGFYRRLQTQITTHGPYREIPGALQYLQQLRHRSDVQLAYATGGWQQNARLKLASAGFPLDGIPLASASDAIDRQHIMLNALAALHGPFESITYFGDGHWDVRATAALGWHFVPVGPRLGGLADYAHHI